MDEFEVVCEPGRGTRVTMTKWRIGDELELLVRSTLAAAEPVAPDLLESAPPWP